jgi:hypothetical protein
MIYHELMIGPVRNHHVHSIYQTPRRSDLTTLASEELVVVALHIVS